ncbi:uncharacterized protein LOC144767485 [Lissotriton helveticus]
MSCSRGSQMEPEVTEVFVNGVLSEDVPSGSYEPAAYWTLSTKEPGMLVRAEPEPPLEIIEKVIGKPDQSELDPIWVISDDSDTGECEETNCQWVAPVQYPGTLSVVEPDPVWNPIKDRVNMAMWVEEIPGLNLVNEMQGPPTQGVESQQEVPMEDPSTLKQKEKDPLTNIYIKESHPARNSEASQYKVTEEGLPGPNKIEDVHQMQELQANSKIEHMAESQCIVLEKEPRVPLQIDEIHSKVVPEKESCSMKVLNDLQLNLDNLSSEMLDLDDHQELMPMIAPRAAKLIVDEPRWNIVREVTDMPKTAEEHKSQIYKDGIGTHTLTEDLQINLFENRPSIPKRTAESQWQSTGKETDELKQIGGTSWSLTNHKSDTSKLIEDNQWNMAKEMSSIPLWTEEPWSMLYKKDQGSSNTAEVPQLRVAHKVTAKLVLEDELLNNLHWKKQGISKQTEAFYCKLLNNEIGSQQQNLGEPRNMHKEIPSAAKKAEHPQWNLDKQELGSLDNSEEASANVLKNGQSSLKLMEVAQEKVPSKVPNILKMQEKHPNTSLRKDTDMTKQTHQSQFNVLNEDMDNQHQAEEQPQWKKSTGEKGTVKHIDHIDNPLWQLAKEPLCTPKKAEEPWRMDLKKERGSPTPIEKPQTKVPLNVHSKLTLGGEPKNKELVKEKGMPILTENVQWNMLNGEASAPKQINGHQWKNLEKDTDTHQQIENAEWNLDKEFLMTLGQNEVPLKKVLKRERGSPKPIEVPLERVHQKVPEKVKLHEEDLKKLFRKEPAIPNQTEKSEQMMLHDNKFALKNTDESAQWKVLNEDTGMTKQTEDHLRNQGKEESCSAEWTIEPWKKSLKKERGSPKPIEVPQCKEPQKAPDKLKLEDVPRGKAIKEEPDSTKQTKEMVNLKISKEETSVHKHSDESHLKIPKDEPGIHKMSEKEPQHNLFREAIGLRGLNEVDAFQNSLNKCLDPSIEYAKRPECPSGQHMYKCLACAKLFTSPSFLHSHYSMHLEQKPGECPVCGKVFGWPPQLQQHLLEHTGPWPYKCCVCQYHPSDPRALLQGSYSNTGDRLYRCISCRLCFVNAYDFQRHKQKHHNPFNGRGFSEKATIRESGRFQCPGCSRFFESDLSLRVHRCRGIRKKLHKCSICGMQFKYPYYLARHYATHTKVKPFQCNICLKSFRRLTHLTRHYLIHSNSQLTPGTVSSISSLEPNSLVQQQQQQSYKEEKDKEAEVAPLEMKREKVQDTSLVKTEPEEGKETTQGQRDGITETRPKEKQFLLLDDWTFLCLACNRAFERKWDVKVHKCPGREGSIEGSRGYQCTVCRKYFARPWSLNRHYRVHTAEKPFTCQECGMSFRLLSSLKQHSRTHVGELPFSCTLCHQSFQKSSDLSHHLQGHAEEEPYRCIYCDRRFSQACSMQQHQQTHAHIHAALRATKEEISPIDNGDYQCHECNTIYPDAKGLQEHDCPKDLSSPVDTMRRKAYMCHVCEKGFKSKYDLASHYLIHTGELPFQCPQCGKRFRRLSHLKQHDVSHTVARPFQCVVCKKEFKRLADLSRHREVHNNQKAHQCGVCYKYFSRSYSLLRHQRSHNTCFVPNTMQESFISNSCFDSQDHSAFAQMEEEQIE